MRKHQLVLPPEYIYPLDDWRVTEQRFAPRFLAQTETIFSVSNGYIGIRGTFEEGSPAFQHGTFINGFYESWAIPYGEHAYGYASTGQTIVNVPDCKIMRLYIDDEPFDLASANILRYRRCLNMQTGILEREVLWETPAGRQILVESARMVSFHEKHVAALRYRVTVLNARAALVISSEVVQHAPLEVNHQDPRQARAFEREVLMLRSSEASDFRLLRSYMTCNSGMALAYGVDHVIETNCHWTSSSDYDNGNAQTVFLVDAEVGIPVTISKYITYHSSRSDKTAELTTRAGRTLQRAVAHGFERLEADQRAYLDEFWARSDIEIRTGHPRLQQSLRWNLFQLLQAVGRADYTGVPAKGLTGQTYEGHYFWDMEMYMLPFLVYSSPRLARNILRYRYSILDYARQRAREVSQRGALYPWRTINGEEASANYAAGTAQYHINAAIAYAIRKYVDISGDRDFLYEYGAEMIVETARLWFDLGFFSDREAGRFCIHSVTGPDEYTTVVNNNTYTNLMARMHLRYAAEVVAHMRDHTPAQFDRLVYRTSLVLDEAQDWLHAAEQMLIPFDERLNIHPQDDTFLEREVWDLAATPEDRFPLLLHYHPLVIYRHQVIKQADIVLAMFLLSHEFSPEQKKSNFDYYDRLTTGDSSLSACIQSIVAAEIGYDEVAIQYLQYALLMDLANVGGNVADGAHIASMGGTWMAIIYGLAGLQDWEGCIRFEPKPFVEKLRFPLIIREQKLEVDIADGEVTYHLLAGKGLTIWHRDEEIMLTAGTPATRSL